MDRYGNPITNNDPRILNPKLYDAIHSYNIELVKELLAKGADPTEGLGLFIPSYYQNQKSLFLDPKSYPIIELLLDSGADTQFMVYKLLNDAQFIDIKLLDIFFNKRPEAFRDRILMVNPKGYYQRPPKDGADTKRYVWLIINGLISVDPTDINILNNERLLSEKYGAPYPDITELEYVKIKLLEELKRMVRYKYKYTMKDILRNTNLLRFIIIYYGKDRVPEILNDLVSDAPLPNIEEDIFRSNKTFNSRKPLLAHRESSGGRRRKTRRRKAKK
jgi:hypothetical protein